MTNLKLVIGNKNYSSWSLRPWLAMKQFGLDFDEIYIPLYQADSNNKLEKYSPSKKVPVLLHDTITVWDSLAICEYLAQEFPDRDWWGTDKKQQAIARSISAEMHSSFQDLRQNMPMNCRARYPGRGMNDAVQKDIERITTIWRECRREFGSAGEMLFGQFTIADAMYAPVTQRFITYGVQLDPISQQYVEAVTAIPAMQQWIADAKIERETISKYEF